MEDDDGDDAVVTETVVVVLLCMLLKLVFSELELSISGIESMESTVLWLFC